MDRDEAPDGTHRPIRRPPDPAAEEAVKPTRFSRGTGRRILSVFVIIVLALGLGYLFVNHEKTTAEAQLADATRQNAAEPPTVDAVTVGLSPATQSLILPGETAAWDETTIYARVNGYVAKWNVDIGDLVKAGQTLATIDTPELDAELLAAKAKLNASVAEVAVKQARADFAKSTAERWLESPKGAVSDQEREDKKAGSAEAIAELAAARAQVALDQANVDRLTALTQFKTVQAPFDGTIVQRQIDTGNLVTAGSTANTSPLYRLVQDDPMRVFVHAPQSAADAIDGARRNGGDLVRRSGRQALRRQGHPNRQGDRSAVAHAARRDRRPERRSRAGPRHVCPGEFQAYRAAPGSRFRPPLCCFVPADRRSRLSTRKARWSSSPSRSPAMTASWCRSDRGWPPATRSSSISAARSRLAKSSN